MLYYSQLLTLAYGGSAKEAGLNGQVIRAPKLEEFASRLTLSTNQTALRRPFAFSSSLGENAGV